jgi:hypothetical protein
LPLLIQVSPGYLAVLSASPGVRKSKYGGGISPDPLDSL